MAYAFSGPPPGTPPGLEPAPGLEGDAAPGLDGAAAPAGDVSASQELRVEILTRISEQVKKSLDGARRESESKVKMELKQVYDKIGSLDKSLDKLLVKLDEAEETRKQVTPEEPLEQATVAKALAKVEQAWGKELGKLKQELHQTIFAHNHNADLMKHQKDALDTIRNELEAQKSPASDRVKLAKAQ